MSTIRIAVLLPEKDTFVEVDTKYSIELWNQAQTDPVTALFILKDIERTRKAFVESKREDHPMKCKHDIPLNRACPECGRRE